MSIIKKISITQFRNYEVADFDISAPVVCITGLNGVGKTNLLDAIYYLCYTKSYFTGYQQQLAKHGTEGFRLEGIFEEGDGKFETVSCKWRSGKKELFTDGFQIEKITDYIGRHTAVMIAPDDIELINDGSDFRRKWIDGILAQTDKRYLESLMQYQQVLSQRNAWLKMNAVKAQHDFTLIDFYDEVLTENGTYIFTERTKFIKRFASFLSDYYRQLSDGREEVTIFYKSDCTENSMSILLKDSIMNDMRMQRTLKGIHRDDLEFYLGGKLIRQYGSQGQKKSYLFALKLGQYRYLQSVLGKTPILLMDDIFEKLDSKRLKALWEIINVKQISQIIITDTEQKRMKNSFELSKDVVNILL